MATNYTHNPTPESVWAYIQETQREMAQRDAEYRALMAQRDAEHKARMAEYDARAEKARKESDERLAKLEKLVGGIGNNNGFFAEEYFFNAMKHKMMFAGIKYDTISPNLHFKSGKIEDEFDMVLFNGTSVTIIETKYRVHKTFLDDLTTKKIKHFKMFCPQYAGHKIYLGVASMSFNADTLDYAHELGIGIIKQNGDTFEFDTENMKAY